MRKNLTVWVLFVLLVGCYSKPDPTPGQFDFRRTRWGMSPQEVILSEDEDPAYKSLNRVAFATEVIGKKVMLEYLLAKNQLYGARYSLVANHVVDDKYVADYTAFQGVLTAKYGKPKKIERVWKKGVGKRKDMHPGTLVSIGHLTMVSIWETPDVEIVATLSGKDFKVNCDVTYTSKAFRDLAQKYDTTDPALGGKGGELSGEMEKATQDF